jgi:hypothetical protein
MSKMKSAAVASEEKLKMLLAQFDRDDKHKLAQSLVEGFDLDFDEKDGASERFSAQIAKRLGMSLTEQEAFRIDSLQRVLEAGIMEEEEPPEEEE